MLFFGQTIKKNYALCFMLYWRSNISIHTYRKPYIMSDLTVYRFIQLIIQLLKCGRERTCYINIRKKPSYLCMFLCIFMYYFFLFFFLQHKPNNKGWFKANQSIAKTHTVFMFSFLFYFYLCCCIILFFFAGWKFLQHKKGKVKICLSLLEGC